MRSRGGGRNITQNENGESYEIISKEDGRVSNVKIIGRAGKATSKKWTDSYNVLDLDTREHGWKDMRQYKEFGKIPENKEVYLGNFEDQQVLESKLKEIESWKRNGIYESKRCGGKR